ncbi:MAG TPA: helix-turn-helix domain-containing protein [Candidatus Methylomirabilis sp.]|nr:helix-turn-helix domain-containing protein [Candidatus Methylomirabilis sp.]
MTQDTAFAILKTGANVFLTGEPGAGKTHLVNRYVAWLRSHGILPAVTASTGIAATHIGGMTIHSWSGIGIQKKLAEEDFGRLLENERLVLRLSQARVLVIDEISMLDARTLECVDSVCRSLRRDGRPFGGIQTVFVGDFFQLPPVSNPEGESPEFAFHSSAWMDAAPTICYLSEQHRQDDAPYLSLLAGLRQGVITEEGHALLRSRSADAQVGESHTRLYSHNVDVDRVNKEKLDALPGEAYVYRMESRGTARVVASLKKSCLSPESLDLKIGARVMFTKNNFEEGYVNGTLGDIKAFDEDDGMPIVRTLSGRNITAEPSEWAIMDGGRTLAKLKQLPLRLAWAITVHKSQGLTLDSAVMDLSRAFEYGQGYVALSRVKSSSGLFLLGLNERALQVHPEIQESDGGFRRQSDSAEAASSRLPAEEQTETERQFILACGGSLETVATKGRKAPASRVKGPSTYEETLALLNEGKTVSEIAEARELVPSTICMHIEQLYADGKLEKADVMRIIPARVHDALPVLQAALKAGESRLSPAFEKFGGRYSYDDLRFARMVM